MRKILTCMLALLLCAGLSGCTKGTPPLTDHDAIKDKMKENGFELKCENSYVCRYSDGDTVIALSVEDKKFDFITNDEYVELMKKLNIDIDEMYKLMKRRLGVHVSMNEGDETEMSVDEAFKNNGYGEFCEIASSGEKTCGFRKKKTESIIFVYIYETGKLIAAEKMNNGGDYIWSSQENETTYVDDERFCAYNFSKREFDDKGILLNMLPCNDEIKGKTEAFNLDSILSEVGVDKGELNNYLQSKINEYKYSNSETEEEVVDSITIGQKNALQSAKNYLALTSGFSYTGLKDQLLYEGFTEKEAIYAVDNCGADWNEQAALSAKGYISMGGFSKQGLLDQLLYEGFTQAQAEYGVSAVGY